MDEILNPAIIQFRKYLYGDLYFHTEFKKFIDGDISANNYLKSPVSIFRFYTEYGVSRNLHGIAGKRPEFLQYLKARLPKVSSPTHVDDFNSDEFRRGYAKDGKSLLSLVSKTAFLYRPNIFIPLDTYAVETIGLKDINYASYIKKCDEYFMGKDSIISNIVQQEVMMHQNIFDYFKITDAEAFTKNRLRDKILWSAGLNKKQQIIST
jgi:hypothetical protein